MAWLAAYRGGNHAQSWCSRSGGSVIIASAQQPDRSRPEPAGKRRARPSVSSNSLLRSEGLGKPNEVIASQRIPGTRDGVAVRVIDTTQVTVDRRVVVEHVAYPHVDRGSVVGTEPFRVVRQAKVDVMLAIDRGLVRHERLYFADIAPAEDGLEIPGSRPHRVPRVLVLRPGTTTAATVGAGAFVQCRTRYRLLVESFQEGAAVGE